MKKLFWKVYRSVGDVIEGWYYWFWFHIEALWIHDPVNRRPFTYMMRDFAHYHPHWTGVICGTAAAIFLGAVMLADIFWCGISWWKHLVLWLISGALFVAAGVLAGHVLWGKDWIPGEQEEPPYLG
ncbi:MAG: hypothetical protein WC359_12330 [Dehalococcoidia bacterium]|jgi:hypothetical protein